MPTTLIRAGRVIDPASGLDRVADVLLHDDRIAAIAPRLDPPADAAVLDADGLLVTPGLIDPHVHLREPGHEHKETLATGAAAAAQGGFTTVCCMPNTSPPLDSPELVRFIADRARDLPCRVFPVAAATKGRRGQEPTEIALLARAGAVGFSDDGDCVADPAVMLRVLHAVAPTGLAFMQHAQDPSLTRAATMHAGSISTRLGLTGWPRVAEEIIVERDVRLAALANCRSHVQHVSSAGSVDILRRARAAGAPITAEASPHHLLLTHEACLGDDGHAPNTAAKVNPPLRESADVRALRQGVAEGVITVLATDHAPHAADEKARTFDEAPFGLIGLESALALYAEALVRTGAIDWPRLIALLTLEPARLVALDALGLGALRVDGPADLTLIDPDHAWTLTEDQLAGRSSNTPFLHRPLRARAVAAFVAGRQTLDRLSARV